MLQGLSRNVTPKATRKQLFTYVLRCKHNIITTITITTTSIITTTITIATTTTTATTTSTSSSSSSTTTTTAATTTIIINVMTTAIIVTYQTTIRCQAVTSIDDGQFRHSRCIPGILCQRYWVLQEASWLHQFKLLFG